MSATSFIWDHCRLDDKITESLKSLHDSIQSQQENGYNHFGSANTNNMTNRKTPTTASTNTVDVKSVNESNLGTQKSALSEAENTCQEFLRELDDLLLILSGISTAHSDVTGRTNNLIVSCENLLEQQHTLQTTVDTLKEALVPFNDIENIAGSLGIPFDSPNTNKLSTKSTGSDHNASTSSSSSSSAGKLILNLDPRSSEFQDILKRLSSAMAYFRDHRNYHDSDRYAKWLEQLAVRATSLIAKAMRELLDNAGSVCRDIAKQQAVTAAKIKALHPGGDGNEQPLESALIYQKFRGLSYRMKELNALLHWNVRPAPSFNSNSSNSSSSSLSSNHGSHGHHHQRHSKGGSESSHGLGNADEEIIQSLKQSYIVLRTELLLPLIKEHVSAAIKSQPSAIKEKAANNYVASSGALSPCIRMAYSTLLRVTQLEQQLFSALFPSVASLTSPSTVTSPAASPSSKQGQRQGQSLADGVDESLVHVQSSLNRIGSTTAADSVEVLHIVESICNATNDCLRPHIIRESNIDELCKVINILAEDVRSQILAMHVPKILSAHMMKSLERTMNDTQERLVYCAEVRLRQDIQMFDPLPSQLAYPDIIETFLQQQQQQQKTSIAEEENRDIGGDKNGDGSTGSDQIQVDISRTWYPPLKSTLMLLSKLYGIVDMAIFEDFARRSVALCVTALSHGAAGVRKSRGSSLNGDFFLIRHLIVLREQLSPFEIRLQSVERRLDFRPTTNALVHFQHIFSQNPRSVLRLDNLPNFGNSLVQLAMEGLPGMEEQQTDAKMELDHVLRNACMSLKFSAIKTILGPLEGFLAKCSAFVGEIPYVNDESQGLPSHARSGGMLADQGHNPHNQDAAVMLSPEMRALLKNQAFVKPDRIKEVVLAVQQTALQNSPDFRDTLKIFIESSVARTVLLKPIQLEIDISRLRMECILSSCVDPGQTKRDLEQLLKSTITTIISELSK